MAQYRVVYKKNQGGIYKTYVNYLQDAWEGAHKFYYSVSQHAEEQLVQYLVRRVCGWVGLLVDGWLCVLYAMNILIDGLQWLSNKNNLNHREMICTGCGCVLPR